MPRESVTNSDSAASFAIARAFFGEAISRRLWAGIAAMTASCALLTMEPSAGLSLPGR